MANTAIQEESYASSSLLFFDRKIEAATAVLAPEYSKLLYKIPKGNAWK